MVKAHKTQDKQSTQAVANVVMANPTNGTSQLETVKQIAPLTPHLVPTSVRLQTIAHWQDGDKTQAKPDSPQNAFLFTEMTEFRPMLKTDLEWTANWFPDSKNVIGGKIVLSKDLVWDKSFVTFFDISLAHAEKIRAAIEVKRNASDPVTEQDYHARDGEEFSPTVRRIKQFDHWETPWREENGFKWMQKYSMSYVVDYNIFQDSGTNGFQMMLSMTAIQTTVTVWTRSFIGFWSSETKRFEEIMKKEIKRHVWIAFHMDVINTTGKLDLRHQEEKLNANDLKLKMSWEYEGDHLATNIEAFDELKKNRDFMINHWTSAAQRELGKANEELADRVTLLKEQSMLVFPAGQTFDIKDPIFNKEGDLVISLTKRKGGTK